MKVASIDTLSCDAGWRNYYFVKLVTDRVATAGDFHKPHAGVRLQPVGGSLVEEGHQFQPFLSIRSLSNPADKFRFCLLELFASDQLPHSFGTGLS